MGTVRDKRNGVGVKGTVLRDQRLERTDVVRDKQSGREYRSRLQCLLPMTFVRDYLEAVRMDAEVYLNWEICRERR